MYSTKNNILYFIVLTVLVQVQSLVELSKEDKDFVKTEAVVRKTVNSIFSILNLEHAKHKAKFGEFAAIHNFFVTITFQDDENLEEIARLAKADNIDNNTQYFITQLNDVLNEDNKTYEATEDEFVTAHIETFIRKLEYLKFKYGFAKNDANFGINTQVLNHLISDDNLQNITKEKINDTDLLSKNEFWNPSASRRIFGGRREKIKRFPFMASVQFFKKFQCGGSIIKSDLVITSASCLQLAWNNRFFRENPAFLSVQVGCDFYEGGDENIPVLEVYFHPQYNPKNLRNNLAIMRLVRALKFGKRISRIKKIDFDRDPWPLPTNTPGITIIGWGAKTSSNIIPDVWSGRLAYAVLDFYPLVECQEVYSSEFVSSKNFCAGFISKGGGACNRDAGGPGVAYGKLFGVVSFGAPTCGAPDAPTVFTKLGYYTEWIEGIMEMEVPTGRQPTTLRTTKEPVNIDSFMISTKATFKVAPITARSATTPLPSLDALRILDESKLFKEFITTTFGSEEVKEYLDQFESDTGTEEQATTRDIARATIIELTTGPTTEADVEENISSDYDIRQDQKGSVRMVTTIDNFEEPKEKETSEEETTTAEQQTVEASEPDQKINEEEQAEQNIAKLIDAIDILDLLSSETSDRSPEDEQLIKPKEPKRNKEKIQPKKKKSQDESVSESRENVTSDDTSDDSSDNNDDNSDDDDEHEDDSDDQPQSKIDKKYSTNTNKKVKKEKRKNNSFKDETFRQDSTGGGILKIFSQKDLLRLLNEVVAEAALSANRKHYSQGLSIIER